MELNGNIIDKDPTTWDFVNSCHVNKCYIKNNYAIQF